MKILKAKFKTNKTSEQSIYSIVCLLFIFVISVIGSTITYITYKNSVNGEMLLGEISLVFLDENNNYISSAGYFNDELTDVVPGDVLVFDNFKIKNVGTSSAYVLLNVVINITNSTNQFTHNYCCNLTGEEVNNLNMALNTTKPSILKVGETIPIDIEFEVPFEISNNFNGANSEIFITALASQVNLYEGNAYTDQDLYASYYICKNANRIANNVINNSATKSFELTTFFEPLRNLNGVQDEVDINTKTITRKIGKYIFTGEESWFVSKSNDGLKFYTLKPENVDEGSEFFLSYFTKDAFDYQAYSDLQYFYIELKPNNVAKDLESFSLLLSELQASNNPLTIWYNLKSANIETF